ncbi:phenylalanine--tRNA ligase subunit beta [Pseudohongiella spirulinae]|uniref:Phenylalanine--tRNA ligase beta subunit n=1 Tax=Pseudohongiella spirulinae TaxID=1249552 RepID=A0A0S2KE57_9GAMM|nr:phenylalanine--tRNA ligase subunit beta [Pseudohongiella spirulinae]ALO46271.1 Phenylalanyl-tRNA synthetase [Pseudohongiella spirulinae]
MIFTKQWIREWLDLPLDPDALVHQLTMAGLEVDASEAVAADFSGIVVAEVQDVQPHPDADKLRVCQVNDGSQIHQVVCGAPNVVTGMRVPYATIGAQLPGKDGKTFAIKKARLRGVESHGMLCSAEELGMAESSDGLLPLPADAPVGENVRDYLQLDDIYFELDLTPNRGDCLSIRGLAREIATLNNQPFKEIINSNVPAQIDDTFPVRIDAPDACTRYLGRVIRDVDVSATTPLWMQEKLRRCGLRSIDPVVDVTNYVLLELGQPMHAFDLERLQDGIVVRMADGQEQITLLDGKVVQPDTDTLLITDSTGPLALAGIMGGEHSGVSEQTRHVFLECACFDALAVAGRARRYGLHTDSSHRYERGVDYNLQTLAIERATELLISVAGGKPGPVTVNNGQVPSAREISLRPDRLAKVLGMSLEDDEIINILNGLGVTLVSRSENELIFDIPSFRFDLSIEADLIEEVARVYGYERLPVTRPGMRMRIPETSETQVPLSRLRERLVAAGYQQVITYSFVEPGLQQLIQPEPAAVALQNPISADMAVMRTSLWPGLLSTLQRNVNRQQHRVRLFETGQVFLDDGQSIKQPERLAGLMYGSRFPKDWSHAREPLDFYDLKGDVEAVLSVGGALLRCRFEPGNHPALHAGQCARIILDGQLVGHMGTLDPRLQRQLDLNDKVFLFELDLAAVSRAPVPAFEPLSRYPEVGRDLALVVDRQLPVGEIEACLRELAGEYLIDMRIFDVYQGDKLDNDKKSVAIGLTWQHPSRTLDDSDINVIIDRCVKGLQDKFNASLRN